MRLHRTLRQCLRLRPAAALASRAPKGRPMARSIVSLASYNHEPPDQPKPYNYRTTSYAKDTSRLPYGLHAYHEYTAWRLHENSRVICVEGSVATGKHEFAKELAKQLGFFYVPQCPVEYKWFNDFYKFYEYDMDEVLEPGQRIYTPASWHKDQQSRPEDLEGYQGRVGGLQLDYINVRTHTYSDALLHLMSTGQGIVTVRTPWSDYAFAQALSDSGYLTPAAFSYYDRLYRNTVHDHPRPHVAIYLDTPVSTILQNIKKRNRDGEATSGKIDRKFLESVESSYQEKVLPIFKEHGEFLMYPYKADMTPHDVSLVVEDIEHCGKLEPSLSYDNDYLNDWLDITKEPVAADLRDKLDDPDYRFKNVDAYDFPHEVPGMVMSVEDHNDRKAMLKEWPGFRYAAGYDPDLDGLWSSMLGPSEQKDLRKFYIPRSELIDDGSTVKTLLTRAV